MASALLHSTGQKNGTLQGGTTAVAVQDSTVGHGLNGGSIKLYSGAAPGTADAAETGTVGVTVTLPNPCFGAAVSGVATANAISTVSISNTITAGYGRVLASGDDGLLSTTERRMQGSVGTAATDIVVNTTTLVAGGTFATTAFTYTHPA